MEYASTSPVATSVEYRNFPLRSTVTASGTDPAGNGEPARGLIAPVLELIKNAEMAPLRLLLMLVTLVTYKNFPEGCINNPCGFSPPVNGEPGMEVRAPVPMLMLNTE